jgi:hypothetical protein
MLGKWKLVLLSQRKKHRMCHLRTGKEATGFGRKLSNEKASDFVILTKYYLGDQKKEDTVGRVCNVRKKKNAYKMSVRKLKGTDNLGNLSIEGE